MKDFKNSFLEDLKYKPIILKNGIIDNNFAKNINNYILLKNSIYMKDTSIADIERQYIETVLHYFKTHKLNFNNIVYWNRSKIDDNGKIYIDGNLVGKDLYSQVCDIFILNNAITKVFEAECAAINLDNFSIEFKNTSKSSKMGGYIEPEQTKKASVRIYEQTLYKNLASDNPEVRIKACKDIFKSLFHEIQHHRLYLITQNQVSNKNALLFAKELTIKRILGKQFYSPNEENGNYYELAIENDANFVGASYYSNIMNDNNNELLDEIEFYKAYMSESKYLIDVQTKDNQKHFKYNGPQEKEDILTKILDEVISPEYINMYPILEKEYNKDGTKKNIKQLINNLLDEINTINSLDTIKQEDKDNLIKETNEMYYELIYREIQKNPESINEIVENMGYSNILNILNNIVNYYSKEKERRIANCKVLSQEKYLDGENPDEVFKEDSDYINNYYNDKCEFILQIIEKIKRNKLNQIEKELSN